MKRHLVIAASLLSVSLATLTARHALAVVDITSGKKPVVKHVIESDCRNQNDLPEKAEWEAARTILRKAVDMNPQLKHHYHAILELYASHEIDLEELIQLTLESAGIEAERSDCDGDLSLL